MATVRLNDAGVRLARRLIRDGEVSRRDAWTFSAVEGSAILGDPPDWDRYSSWHLGIRTGTSRKTKQGYAYPFGKGGRLYRSALIAARQRAAQQAHSAIFNAAGKLLQDLDGRSDMTSTIRQNMEAIGAFATAPRPVEWEELPQLVIQLLPFTGDETLELVDGREVRVDDDSIRSIAERFGARENPLVLDYEHGTYNPMLEMGSLAAGWIEEIWPVASDANIAELADDRVREAASLYGPGVYAVIHLTEKAAGLVEAREYAFVSPVVVQNEDFVVLEILGAGLTNDPAIDGMMPIAAKRTADGATMESARGDETSDAASEGSTDPAPGQQGDRNMDIEVLAALVGRKLESEADVKAAILELKAKADGSEENAQRVAELEAERLDREATEAVSTAISEGRLAGTDKAKEWATALFKSDRDAWTSYLAATEKGTFSKETKVPPQDRLTDDTKTGDGSIDFPDSVRFFGKEIQVNEEQLETLKKAIRLSRETFNGDLAKAIRAVRR